MINIIKYGSNKCMNNSFSCIPRCPLLVVEVVMINFSNKKNKRLMTGILIVILIVAMVVPMVVYMIP